ncbi:hypothetical protein KJ975_09780 [Myxococcota bacterium]|nr:hypothetical protein [Myxococcota bacterium]
MSGRSRTEISAWRWALSAAAWLLPVTGGLLPASGCGFHWVTGDGRVGEVSVCDGSGCDTEFLSATEAITLRIAVDDAPFGTRIASHWYYIEPPLTRVLMRERIADVDHPQWVVHRMEPPRVGHWKPGTYLVEVTLRDRIVTRKTFRIAPVPAPVPVAAPAGQPMSTPGMKDILDDDF